MHNYIFSPTLPLGVRKEEKREDSEVISKKEGWRESYVEWKGSGCPEPKFQAMILKLREKIQASGLVLSYTSIGPVNEPARDEKFYGIY